MRIYIALICMLACMESYAQQATIIKITDRYSGVPLPFATVIADSVNISTADSLGIANLTLPAGNHKLKMIITGYQKLDTLIMVPAGATIQIGLMTDNTELENVTIVAATRNNQSIENSPMKVEVLGAEEVSEEAGIKPGNIASILGDVSGVQIQQSSATSGNSNVRIQGLDGRYTQILRDGMPLYDGFSGGFGILTIPPLDLKQIELIKGAASTLYGGGAIGGLVNLVSKRPTTEQSVDALVNYTSLKEFNGNIYLAKRNKHFGYTLFAGYTMQQAVDVDKDGLSDVPNVNSVVVHPRLFWYPGDKTSVALGYSGSFDERKGGDMLVLAGNTDMLHQYYERNNSQRHTGDYEVEHSLTDHIKLTVKGTASNFDRELTTNTHSLHGKQISYYNEASVLIPVGKSSLVAGINIVGDDYNAVNTPTAKLQEYGNFTTGAFAQYSLRIKENTTLEAGMRLDDHRTYGIFALPRIAGSHRFSKRWAGRAGFGMGYKVPNPLVQQNIDYNPLQLMAVDDTVRPELSYGYNAELNYKQEWENGLSLFINQAFFLTRIEHPILFYQNTSGIISLYNADKPIVTKGFDTYAKLGFKSWELYLGYTYTDAQNTYINMGNSFMPLTPRNRCAMVLTKEIQKLWRIGLEGSYTGSQYRYDGTATPGYVIVAIMVQRNIGTHISLVLNCENLPDSRMSRVEQVYTGSITDPTFKPLWAPIDGRVVNLSLRWKL